MIRVTWTFSINHTIHLIDSIINLGSLASGNTYGGRVFIGSGIWVEPPKKNLELGRKGHKKYLELDNT